MKVVARLARTGVQSYGDHVEQRDASEVFAAESLASYRGAPVTVGHRAMVDASNVRALAVGYVRAVSRDRGDGVTEYVRGELVITDAQTAADIRAGKLVELSMGYTMTPDGNRQTGIRINHAALLPAGGARCGSACSIASR